MGSMFLYDPKLYPKEHQRYDIDFKKYCCGAAGLCDEYRKRRPSRDCADYIPPISCKYIERFFGVRKCHESRWFLTHATFSPHVKRQQGFMSVANMIQNPNTVSILSIHL